MIRRFFVWLHRYVGLALALFLVIEGATGSLLAFKLDLANLLDPRLVAQRPSPQAQPLDLATLFERAEAIVPNVKVVGTWYAPRDDQVSVRVEARTDPATGEPYHLDYDLMWLDPWTGNVLGWTDKLGFNEHGLVANVMPFIYELHSSLALGQTGVWILAIVALLWTIDCYVGFYLTLPLKLESFWRRWKPAWVIKWRGGFYRVNFDLHRAGGLWFWAMLFVFAWSSVDLLDLTGSYNFVTCNLFDCQSSHEQLASVVPPDSKTGPLKLDWRAAQATGEKLMAELALRKGFKIEKALWLDRDEGVRQYIYRVRTDRWFPNDRDVIMYFDADTGAFKSLEQTKTGHSGDTLTNWLAALHLVGNPVDWLAYRIFVVIVGIVIVMLSVTGVYVWWKKRKARADRVTRESAIPPIRQGSLQTNQTTEA